MVIVGPPPPALLAATCYKYWELLLCAWLLLLVDVEESWFWDLVVDVFMHFFEPFFEPAKLVDSNILIVFWSGLLDPVFADCWVYCLTCEEFYWKCDCYWCAAWWWLFGVVVQLNLCDFLVSFWLLLHPVECIEDLRRLWWDDYCFLQTIMFCFELHFFGANLACFVLLSWPADCWLTLDVWLFSARLAAS